MKVAQPNPQPWNSCDNYTNIMKEGKMSQETRQGYKERQEGATLFSWSSRQRF